MRSSRFAVVIAALALTVTACGGDDEPAEGSRATPPAPAQPDTAAEAAARRAELERARNVIAETINFDFDRSDIRADARPILDRKLEVLRANTSYRIRIEGHCDERGTDAYNMRLGMRRANAARQYLVDQGINASRIETTSLGEGRPLDTGHNREAWARNRRAEFQIVAGPGT